MKKMNLLFLVILGLITIMVPENAFALARRPQKSENPIPPPMVAPKKPLPTPNARDMQVATGQIPSETQDSD